jgi:diacylglycerol kinase (ATP)
MGWVIELLMTQRSVSRWASLGHAVRGLQVLLRQPNARIHTLAACVVVALAYGLQVSASEWLALVLAIGLVMGAEALNTALEFAVDLAQPEWHALARDAKDVAAAGVLICSLAALVVGLVVFGPRLWVMGWGG